MINSKIQRRHIPIEHESNLVSSGIDPLMSRLLAARGITEASDVSNDLIALLPFSQLLNAEKAGKILAEAVRADKHIVVSCDFDVDGCSAGALALRGLRMMGAKRVDFAMPDRARHGYGLSPLLVDEIQDKFHPDLIVTVDCGVSSFDGIARAKSHGIDVLVTDHHLVGKDGDLPDAICIVNPNQPDCTFQSKNIAGVGVIFYVMLALRAEFRNTGYFTSIGIKEPNLSLLLDLVALATIADVVKLDKNNRILVKHGLDRIRSGHACAGINALMAVAKKQVEKASVFDMGFIIGPRLNAAGRIEDMSLGMRCLITDDKAEAAKIASELDAINIERRSIEAGMKDSALELLSAVKVEDRFSIVMYNPEWHQGVIGILSSRLKELHGRPVITFAKSEEGVVKGSGRSIPSLHMRDAIDLVSKRNPGLVLAFGGHAMAAGLTVPKDRFNEFADRFDGVVHDLINESDLMRVIETDGQLPASGIDVDVVEKIEQAVWGQGFPNPTFDDDFAVIEQRVLKDTHLKLKLGKNGNQYDAIWFFHKDTLPEKARFVFSLNVNDYNGCKSVQMLVNHAECEDVTSPAL